MSSLNAVSYLFSLLVIWFGAGLIISSVDKLSKKWKVSSFAVSFFLLGLLTSIPEFAVGLTSISKNNSEIFVGNLIGGVVVIFLFIIPLLAIFGKGIKLNSQLNDKNLLTSFIVMLAPAFLIMDRRVTNFEGALLIGLYFYLFYVIQTRKGVLDIPTLLRFVSPKAEKSGLDGFIPPKPYYKVKAKGYNDHGSTLHRRYYSYIDILKILLGVGLVFVSSNTIVDGTLYFAAVFNVPAFYISLIALSLGTNIPEISIAVRSIYSGKKDIAFGDYVGSAAANTLLFGFFTILNSGEVITVNNFTKTFVMIAFGLGLFFYFSRSKHDISRKEGLILFLLYFIFTSLELLG